MIADIVGSPNLEEHGQAQSRVIRVLYDVNRRGRPIVSPHILTLDDEFQAVFSCGVGEITTAINTAQALGMDGPAFYAARDGLEDLKGSGAIAAITGLAGPPAHPSTRPCGFSPTARCARAPIASRFCET